MLPPETAASLSLTSMVYPIVSLPYVLYYVIFHALRDPRKITSESEFRPSKTYWPLNSGHLESSFPFNLETPLFLPGTLLSRNLLFRVHGLTRALPYPNIVYAYMSTPDLL